LVVDNRYGKMIVLVCCTIFILWGCTARRIKSYEESGFLGDYSQLVKGGENKPNLVYVKPGIDLRPYDKVMIDQVVVFMNPHSEHKGIQPDQMMELSKYFHQALTDSFKVRYEIVDGPGPGVLRIRTAITDVEPGRPVANSMSTVIPVGMAASAVNRAVNDSNLGVGRASVEVELLDSVSNERLAAAVDRREGRKRVVSGKWTDIKKAFDYWAERLRTWMEQQNALKNM
jgi:hypothetical protein